MGDLKCILCGETDNIHLNVTDGDTLHCHACDGEFTTADVREQMGLWAKVLTWLDAHPAREDERAEADRAARVPA